MSPSQLVQKLLCACGNSDGCRQAILGCICAALKRQLLSCSADFSNLVSQMHLQDLAEADAVKEQVQQVQVCWQSCKQHITALVDSSAQQQLLMAGLSSPQLSLPAWS